MGVTGLWDVVKPTARPIKIDTLHKKRLAVDASIWIYQFLKAVRDKEGNALRNSHVVGFFRRICKLLFFGIKPVFVFDGGAPALKRQTISGRKQRREGRREDAVRTAGKLLALQMQRRAEEEEQRRKDEDVRPAVQEQEEEVPENPVYVDELQMSQQERHQNRRFKKKDQYHLPELDMPLAEMGGPNDPRVMSMEELEQYARQFDTGEDINVYDFSKIDYNSPFFTSLPATDRYNILNAARLRSRLRLGYSKDQLDSMFPNRMEFSRFQIERVRERNELTQRLMQVGTVDDGTFDADSHGRVAGEKGREYVLVKNPGVEGGWALGVIGDKDNDAGQRQKPIDVEESVRRAEVVESESEGEEITNGVDHDKDQEEILKRRRAFYDARKKELGGPSGDVSPAQDEDPDSLFIGDETTARIDGLANVSDEEESEDEETQLQLAIAMSMQNDDKKSPSPPATSPKKRKRPKFHQSKAKEHNPFATADARTIAHNANQQARRAAPQQPTPQPEGDVAVDMDSALAESRQSKRQPKPFERPSGKPMPATQKHDINQAGPAKASTGPLPFEKLDLGSSLLGKTKMKKIEEDTAGGFEKDEGPGNERKAEPLPPWFAGDVKQGLDAQKASEEEEKRKELETKAEEGFEFETQPRLRPQGTTEIIDVDRDDEEKKVPIQVDSSEDEADLQQANGGRNVVIEDTEVRMGDVADLARVEPPSSTSQSPGHPDASRDDVAVQQSNDVLMEEAPAASDSLPEQPSEPLHDSSHPTAAAETANESDESAVEWSDSDREEEQHKAHTSTTAKHVAQQASEGPVEPTRSESPDDVYLPSEEQLESFTNADEPQAQAQPSPSPSPPSPNAAANETDQPLPPDDDNINMPFEDDDFSDPEDDALLAQLTQEAEEHARFTSHFNSTTPAENLAIYEKELSALRTQQKKDRRDADEVTHIMVSECQQLLKLFGLPYITAPMEAEAQCAELVQLGLVDGIVTDDSDIFLFGGTRIYKNMFNQAKFVECYLTSDLVRDFDLTRQKLIRIAYLLGSDYTEGLPGVGPVTALEILGEFDDLPAFRDWWSLVQSGAPPSDPSAWRRKFSKSNATKLFLAPGFPDPRVELAYLEPEVDSDPSAFQWGVPDLNALRSYLMATIGWSQERTDEVLVPVIRDMNRREDEGTQANITQFLGGGAGGAKGQASSGAGAFAPRVRDQGKSRRMEGALEKMAERARRKRREEVDGGQRRKGEGVSGDADAADVDVAVISAPGTAVDEDAAAAAAAAPPGTSATKTKARGRGKKRKAPAAAAAPTVENDEHDDEHDTHEEPPVSPPTKSRRKNPRREVP
ncbi:MAG: DNA repair protein rad2 [Chrysothrix sp. TS-e1954]|nr:MAG: DNA repair protein rad2 [Chrysothrix sp. TS-e1954]